MERTEKDHAFIWRQRARTEDNGQWSDWRRLNERDWVTELQLKVTNTIWNLISVLVIITPKETSSSALPLSSCTTTKKNARGKMTSLPVANFRWKGSTMGILRNFRLGMRTPFHPFGHRLTWIILRPLSALSLDEGLNALSDKNPSGCWLVQSTNQMSDISAYAK